VDVGTTGPAVLIVVTGFRVVDGAQVVCTVTTDDVAVVGPLEDFVELVEDFEVLELLLDPAAHS